MNIGICRIDSDISKNNHGQVLSFIQKLLYFRGGCRPVFLPPGQVLVHGKYHLIDLLIGNLHRTSGDIQGHAALTAFFHRNHQDVALPDQSNCLKCHIFRISGAHPNTI